MAKSAKGFRSDNSRQVGIRLNERLDAMLVEIAKHLGYKSRASVIDEAIRVLYKKTFPQYTKSGSAGLGFSAGEGLGGFQKKVAEKAEIDKEKMMYYEHVAKMFPRGRIVHIESGVEGAMLSYSRFVDRDYRAPMDDIPLKMVPITTGVWSDEPVLRAFVMRKLFHKVKWDDSNPEKLRTTLRGAIRGFLGGIEANTTPLDEIPVLVRKQLYELALETNALEGYSVELETLKGLAQG